MTSRSTVTRKTRAAVPQALSLLAIAALLTVVAVPAQSAVGAPQPAADVVQTAGDIPWTDCATEGAAAFDCATIEVPSDYDEPYGPTTTVAVTRLPARDQENRIGSAVVNFGGPGGPGVATLHQLGEVLFDAAVRDRFDIVSFDPRGVGTSDPTTCFATPEEEQAYLGSILLLPQDASQNAQFIEESATLARGCTVFGGDRLATASTANVARDMDVLRERLGEDTLTYVGYSYGTVLGATYGALFPDNIRALVLDGTLDPRVWTGDANGRLFGDRIRQAEGTYETYGEFVRLCREAAERCALNGLGDPADVVEEVYAALKEQPVELPVGDGTTIQFGYGHLVYQITNTMYDTAGWANQAAFIAQLAFLTGVVPQASAEAQGSGLSISELLRRLGVSQDYPSIGGQVGPVCTDADFPGRPRSYPDKVAALDAQYPHFGLFRGWLAVQCEFIDIDDEDAYTGPWEQSTQQPVLVIGTRFDPATNYGFTAPYADLWPDARTLTVDGWGHTTIGRSSCADAAIAEYLVTLEADDGAVCQQDLVPFGLPAAS